MKQKSHHQHPFENILSVGIADIELGLRGFPEIAWADFVLNPRRLRGSDFLMRWSQGVWSEKRLIDAVNATGEFFAIAYGPSGTAPDNDVRAFELYFERLEAAGLGNIKRPDLLVFKGGDKKPYLIFSRKLAAKASCHSRQKTNLANSSPRHSSPLNVKIHFGWRKKCQITQLR